MGGETNIFDLEAQLLWNHDRVSGYNEQMVEGLFVQYRNSAECNVSDQTVSHDIVSCVNVLHFFMKIPPTENKFGSQRCAMCA
jgi:hypothetical protein